MKDLNKDDLYKVLKEPTLENFRELLQNHMDEEDYLDFKKEWESNEKMSKHILAMANSGGGCIILGVEQNGDGSFGICGLKSLKDPAKLKEGIKGIIPDSLEYLIKDFKYESSEYKAMENKKFQILIIKDNPKSLPYVCCKDGNDIKDGEIYIRTGTESRRANNYQIEKVIDRKLNACKIPKNKDISLEKHLKHLKILYSELTYTTDTGWISSLAKVLTGIGNNKKTEKKELYPKEDYDDFILKVLNKKKKRIEEELDILDQ